VAEKGRKRDGEITGEHHKSRLDQRGRKKRTPRFEKEMTSDGRKGTGEERREVKTLRLRWRGPNRSKPLIRTAQTNRSEQQ